MIPSHLLFIVTVSALNRWYNIPAVRKPLLINLHKFVDFDVWSNIRHKEEFCYVFWLFITFLGILRAF